MIPIISIVAWSGTGKTTYMEKLIPALKERGLRIAVVKHDGHGFEIDKKGKDSYRITKAGSDITGLISKDKAVLMENRPVTSSKFINSITDVDLILTEGYKSNVWPKIMLYRQALGKGYACPPAECIAVVSDDQVEGAKLQFHFDEVDEVADLLAGRALKDRFPPNPLCNVPFLKGVGKETLHAIWSAGKVKEYPKNTVLFHARTRTSYIYIQLSGQTMIYTLTNNGNRKVIFIYGAGNLLNDHVLDSGTSSVYCETILSSVIFSVPVSDFMEHMREDFALTKAVFGAQERKMWRMSHQLKNTTSSTLIERKLAAKLWKLSRDFHKPAANGAQEIEIDVNLSITFLSDLLGTPRETTSRACKTLTGYGFIRIDKKRITILDKEGIVNFYKHGTVPGQ